MTEYEVDVLVVGYGAAGANAAIAAHDAGARVMITEKLGAGGGNSAVCAGAMVFPRDIESGVAYYRALSAGTVDEAAIRAFVAAMVGVPALLKRLGLNYTVEEFPRGAFPALMAVPLSRAWIAPTGQGGFQLLDGLVRQRGIAVALDTKVTRLIQEGTAGQVVGAQVRQAGTNVSIKVRRGVVLACGGYGSNSALLANFNVPALADHVFCWGSPGNAGDGIALASAAGAALWHMATLEWGKMCAAAPSRRFGTAVGYGIGRARRPGSFLFVNRSGQRFMAEDSVKSHTKAPLEILRYNHALARYANLPAYMVFDAAHLARGPIVPTAATMRANRGGLVGHAIVNGVYDWSADNNAEISAGWVMRADSLAALANTIGADPDTLERTVRRFNSACGEGCDAEFGRKANTLVPFGAPPYYAVELGMALVNTQGGPRRDGCCRVLDHRGEPVPRLYAAGELGSFFGFLYQGGSNYPEAWATGAIAGARAAENAMCPERHRSLATPIQWHRRSGSR